MKFSEEYKSAMNEISPDEKTSRRIENAVMERISVPAKKKKPFYVYAGALSGAAACIAVLCVVLINVNGGSLVKDTGGMALAPTGSAGLLEDYTTDASPSSVTNETADMIFTESTNDKINSFQSAGSAGFEAPAAPEDTESENCATVPKDNVVSEEVYSIEFLTDGTVAVKGNGINAVFRPDNAVTHFTNPQQDLSKAKTQNGELYQIRLESNFLYIFGDDLQTADCYKLA